MPRVRILQAVAGEDFSWMPGDEIDMSARDAKVWADGFRGELVRGEIPQTPERASAAPETAATRRSRKAKASEE